MAKIFARTAISTILLLIFFNAEVSGRFSHFKTADQLVSDGQFTDNAAEEKIESSVLRLGGVDHSTEAHCEHMYGFLPCSESLLGHLFLAVVYEFLLFHGETYILSASSRIFEILGSGFFGASGFLVIAKLPEPLILLVTGLFSSHEAAQENVLTGVGMIAGSTILNLTLLWGTCLFFGRQVFVQEANASPVTFAETEPEKPPKLLTGYGVGSDEKTSSTAKVMLVSLIPLIILVLPKIFDVPYNSRGYNTDILVAFLTLVLILFAYFIYQFSHRSLEDRRLYYLRYVRQTHVLAVIQHVQELIPELMDEHGMPDETAILRLFHSLDTDGDGQLSATEIMELFHTIRPNKLSVYSRERIVENLIKELDHNGNKFISIKEFVDTFKHWLHTVCAVDEPSSHSLVPRQPIKKIKNIYEATTSELEQGKLNNVRKESLEEARNIDSDENNNSIKSAGSNTNRNQVKISAQSRFQAIFQLLVGIAMVAILAEPLIHSVQNFASSANIPSFYVAFVLVPVATSARTAILAIQDVTVRDQIPKDTRLTFSEIYDGVFMNNVLGFSVLLSIVNFRGLIWHFSAEVMIVVIVCSTMGLIASFKSRFPVWMMFIAISLYPLSLIFVYFIDDYFWLP